MSEKVVWPVAAAPCAAQQKSAGAEAVLWRNPADMASGDLFCGSCEPGNAPHEPFVFFEEDLSSIANSTSGREARPEAAASRLVRAVSRWRSRPKGSHRDALMCTTAPDPKHGIVSDKSCFAASRDWQNQGAQLLMNSRID